MTGITLKDRRIGPGAPVFVIAEAGVNHNGNLDFALGLVDVAADAGADAVKFQTFKAEHLNTRFAPKADYHVETTGSDAEQSWFELLKSEELTAEMHEAVIARCAEREILFLSTPYDEESADLLESLDVPLFKIASTDADNIPFLEYVAAKGRPMILSTAMCEMDEIDASVAAIRAAGVEELVVMQCTGSYPAPAADANLRAMHTIAERCGVAVGYSDHVSGTTTAIAAVALGACAYEKHFTLDGSLPGPDHRASMEPGELKDLIGKIRIAEAALGDGVKRVMPCEAGNRDRLRKNIVARRPIRAGEKFSRDNLTTKRAGGQGLHPPALGGLLGRTARVDIAADQFVTRDMVG